LEESTTRSERTKSRTRILKSVRQLHLWLGTFFAPAIIFFAFSGALQTFGLHEGRRGDPYQPPAWIAKIAQIHKKQNLETRPPGPPPGGRAGELARPPAENHQHPNSEGPATFAFKVFTGMMAMGLISTTLLGLFMTFQFAREKRVTWALLILGTVLPLAMISLM
jgi:hypothetical protein